MQNEFEGKTVEDAIAAGLKALGISEHEADIEVIQRGNRGIFGIGSSTALVRISERIGGAPAAVAESSATTSATAQAETSVDSSTSEPSSFSADAAIEADAESVVDDEHDEDSTSHDSSSQEVYDEEEISDDELADMAMDMLGKTISLMGYDVEITARWKDPEPGDDERCLTLEVEGDNLGPLIGRRGETLDNLQYMLRLMVNQKIRAWCNIVVDVASYKSRRAEQLTQMATRIAAQVAETGRPESLEPMPSNERRIVHLTLRDHADVYTESIGESDRRKVHVVPKSLTS